MVRVAGIDVGGAKKGFQVAILRVDNGQFEEVRSIPTAERVVQKLEAAKVQVVAIDCPPKCRISGPDTRLAERELHARGFRVQWTRRAGIDPQEWMENGADLWRKLGPLKAKLIETFPTAASERLSKSDLAIPMRFFGREERLRYKDLIDACICAAVAAAYLDGKAEIAGEQDELGPIYY